MEYLVKQVKVPVLLSNTFGKVLNVDEYMLSVNIYDSRKVRIIVERSRSDILSRIAKSWLEPIISDRGLAWVSSFGNPENNQRYMLSNIEDTINCVQKSFVRTFDCKNVEHNFSKLTQV